MERRGNSHSGHLSHFQTWPPTHVFLWGRPCLEQILEPWLAWILGSFVMGVAGVHLQNKPILFCYKSLPGFSCRWLVLPDSSCLWSGMEAVLPWWLTAMSCCCLKREARSLVILTLFPRFLQGAWARTAASLGTRSPLVEGSHRWYLFVGSAALLGYI